MRNQKLKSRIRQVTKYTASIHHISASEHRKRDQNPTFRHLPPHPSSPQRRTPTLQHPFTPPEKKTQPKTIPITLNKQVKKYKKSSFEDSISLPHMTRYVSDRQYRSQYQLSSHLTSSRLSTCLSVRPIDISPLIRKNRFFFTHGMLLYGKKIYILTPYGLGNQWASILGYVQTKE